MKIASRTGAVATAAVLSLVLAACTPSNEAPTETPTGTTTSETPAVTLSGNLSGAGSSAQESAMEAWRAGFQAANPGVTVNYDAVGSGGGRTQFLDGAVSFAGSDALMKEDEYAAAVDRCYGDGGAIHLPTYISPIAVLFNLDGIDSLNMTADVIASIFDGGITNWNDSAIADLNAGVSLPDLAITPVHRSDESGTTSNFTDYLEKASTTWPYERSGEWPNSIGEGGPGTSGLITIVQDTNGAIGYADASRAGTLGTVALGVGDAFVPFTPEAAAAAVGASPIGAGNGEHDLAYAIDRTTTAAGAYPLVLVTYEIVCKAYEDVNEGNLVVAFLTYVASAEGQAASASAAGSSPIGATIGAQVQAAIDSIEIG